MITVIVFTILIQILSTIITHFLNLVFHYFLNNEYFSARPKTVITWRRIKDNYGDFDSHTAAGDDLNLNFPLFILS